jgi:prepilin-type N-terminal cleavage/methylation domain-containing protein
MHLKFQPEADPPMAEIQNTKYPLRWRIGKKPNTNSGFTLIEMLVVVSVVGVGLIGALSFFNINLNSQFEARNELIAAGLAQEGADLVRNKVDFEKLKGTSSWTAIADDMESCTRIDYRSLSGTTHSCNAGNDYICFSGGRYQQCASGKGTNIQRNLRINHKTNADGKGDRLEVQCNVIWNGRTTMANDVIYGNSY